MQRTRRRPGLRYALVGLAAMAAIIVIGTLLNGVTTTPSSNEPAADATTSASPAPVPSTEPSAITTTPTEVDENEIVSVAQRYVEAYYSINHEDTEQARKRALSDLVTAAHLESLKLGFDPELEADTSFVANQTAVSARAGDPLPGDIEDGRAELTVPVSLVTTSSTSEATSQSFLVRVYLIQDANRWLVEATNDTA